MTDSEYVVTDAPPAPPAPKPQMDAPDYWHDYQRRLQQSGANLAGDLAHPEKPNFSLGHTAKTALDTLDYLTSPLSAAWDFAVGRPVEYMSGGKISRQTAGDVASIAIPLGGEVMSARMAASAARKLGVTVEEFAKMMKARQAVQASTRALRHPELARNVKTLERTGIEPSLLAATESRPLRRAASTAAQNVLTAHFPHKAVSRVVEGLTAKGAETSARLGRSASATEAGERVKEGVERFAKGSSEASQVREDLSPAAAEAVESAARRTPSRTIGFGNKANILYQRAFRLIGQPLQLVEMPKTEQVLGEINARFQNPELREAHTHPFLKQFSKTLEASKGKLSWQDAREFRTTLRAQLLNDPKLAANVTEGQVKQLYSALTEDIMNGAYKIGNKAAGDAFAEANKFYAAGQARIENALERVFNAKSGDEVFHELIRDGQSGAKRNLDRLMQVRRSLTGSEWRDFAASVIDHMGVSLPGVRTQDTPWSFSTFLTNFNKLDEAVGARDASAADSGLKVLFEGAGHGETLSALRDMARSSELMRELHKFHNFSNSGSLVGNMAVMGALFGAHEFHSMNALIAMGLTGNLGLKAIESPTFVRWLAALPERGNMSTLERQLDKLGRLAKDDPSLKPIYYGIAANFFRPGQENLPPDHEEPKPAASSDDYEITDDPNAAPAENQIAPPGGEEKEPKPFSSNADVSNFISYHLGAPITITSGYRTPEHNAELPGASEHSAHMKGEAWDFVPQGVSMQDAGEKLAASGMPFDQIEITPTHVHVSFDPRNRGSVIYVGWNDHDRDPGGAREVSALPDISDMSDDDIMGLAEPGDDLQ